MRRAPSRYRFARGLEEHRKNPACAVCHRIMDPVGFALENFDAVGQWRDNDAGDPIDASGVLGGWHKVDGPVALRNAIASRPETFASTMTEKMLTYALGRAGVLRHAGGAEIVTPDGQE
jgi:hypothetical protein